MVEFGVVQSFFDFFNPVLIKRLAKGFYHAFIDNF